MEIAIPLFDRFTALDAVGPYQVLSALPEARVRFIAAEAGPVRADNRMLTLVAEASLDDVPEPDILVVPGGIGTRALLEDERWLGWVRTAHETLALHDLRLHRLAAAGRRRRARRHGRHHPLDGARPARRAGRQPRARTAWSSAARW